MSTYISKAIKALVVERAKAACEYCLVPDYLGLAAYEFDHIISQKQGGDSEYSNLAYCCQFCNRSKGTNISSFLGAPPKLLPLFNPRVDVWSDHFYYTENGRIHPITPIGSGTIYILNMNERLWIERRAAFIKNGLLAI